MEKVKMEYYDNGNIRNKIYLDGCNYHRLDGPTVISYYENGNIKREIYYANNRMHRTDGPAYILYYRDGSIRCEEYHINGKSWDEFEYLVYIGSMKG